MGQKGLIFLNKITSGRWLLTVICGGVFAYMSCAGLIDPKDALTIIGIVITFYFTRKRDEEEMMLLLSTTSTTTLPNSEEIPPKIDI